MTFPEYWILVVQKFSHLENEENMTTIKISSLKALMRQSHQEGFYLGESEGAYKQYNRQKEDDLFEKWGGLFGFGKK